MTPPGYREGPAYYNDTDPFCCEWLQRLMDAGEITPGTIDNRSITDVKPDDLAGYERVHFFAGIGGWELAMRLAGWSGPVWTGSCPCQPYSAAGKRQGDADPRNLWPAFFRLIRECRPPVVFGEQVSSAIRHGWLDGICGDLEAESYAVGAAVLGAHSVGAPHIRQRLYWVADASNSRHPRAGAWAVVDGDGAHSVPQRRLALCKSAAGCEAGWLADAEGPEARPGQPVCAGQSNSGSRSGLGEPDSPGPQSGYSTTSTTGHRHAAKPASAWPDFAIVQCRDSKARRTSAQPGDEPLAHGIPRSVGSMFAGLAGMAKPARRNCVGRLRGYGNAIVPPVAAEFLRAYMEARYADT